MRLKTTILALLSALFMCTAATAQTAEQQLKRFAAHMLNFNQICPQEKIYLQFDNTSYYAGETIWFKAFVVNAADNHRAPSKVLYVDLISPGGDILKQEKLQIVAGQADGSFELMDAATAHARELRGVLPYPSGFYEIRAYTAYMLNFSDEILFSRVLPVFEKPEKDGNYYGEQPTVREVKDEELERNRKLPDPIKGIEVTFYPEGGHLIAGVPNRMAFKVMGSDGLGVNVDGRLADGTPLKCVHDGMGSVTFTPAARNGRAEFRFNDRRYTFPIPETESDGYLLKADAHGGTLTATVQAAGEAPADSLGITLTCRGELKHFSTVYASASASEIEIPLDGVPEGVSTLTLFDRNGKVISTRHIYVKGNLASPSIAVTADKKHYEPFELMKLDFDLTDGAGQPFRDRFCLSVRDAKCPGTAVETDIRSSLLLSSDLRGLVYKPEYYFEADDAEHAEALDLLMLVQGWEKYDWKIRAGAEHFYEIHRMEKSLTLNGWVLQHFTDRPGKNVGVAMAVVPSDRKLTQRLKCSTDSTGYFGFDMEDFYNGAKLTLIARQNKKSLIQFTPRMTLERALKPEIKRYTLAARQLKEPEEEKKQEAAPEDTIETNYPTIIQEDLGYLLPDAIIEDSRIYIDYFTFKAFDVQRDANDKFDKGEFATDIEGYLIEKDIQSKLTGSIPPFYYVHDQNNFLYDRGNAQDPFSWDTTYNTMDIVSMQVFDKPIYYHDILNLFPLYTKSLSKRLITPPLDNGQRYYVIDIQVKERNKISTRKEEFDLSRRVTSMQGFSQPYEFYSPQYPDGAVYGDVDYRRTLYWNPNVITDASGHAQVQFYNNSYSTHYRVTGAGITASGTPYSLDSRF